MDKRHERIRQASFIRNARASSGGWGSVFVIPELVYLNEKRSGVCIEEALGLRQEDLEADHNEDTGADFRQPTGLQDRKAARLRRLGELPGSVLRDSAKRASDSVLARRELLVLHGKRVCLLQGCPSGHDHLYCASLCDYVDSHA